MTIRLLIDNRYAIIIWSRVYPSEDYRDVTRHPRRLRLHDAPLVADISLYAGSAAFGCWLLRTSDYVTFLTWAGIAVPLYIAAAAVSFLALLHGRLLCPTKNDDTLSRLIVRWCVAGVVTLGVCLVPVTAAVAGRATQSPDFANSEVVVIESAAAQLVHGHDPYSTTFGSHELNGRLPAIRDNFPYLPGMAVFGIPKVAAPRSALADARLSFLVVSVGALWAALGLAGLGSRRSLRVWQVTITAPTGCLALTAGGDDIPVISLCFLALVLLAKERSWLGVSVLIAATLLKLTAWPFAASAALALLSRRLHAQALTLAVVPVAAVTTLLIGSTGAADDLFAYPFGLKGAESPIRGRTLGTILLAPLWSTGAQLLPVLLVVLLAVAALAAEGSIRAMRRFPAFAFEGSGSAAIAAGRAAMFSAAFIGLAPAWRPGYMSYPVNALLWTVILRSPRSQRGALGTNQIRASRRPRTRSRSTIGLKAAE